MRLDSVRVLDLSRLLPGPYATQLLADMGADVIKIEDPDVGDYARGIEPSTESGEGAVFSAVNRGKRSVALDLKAEEGLAAFYSLAEDADVVFEQFRPGVADRLGVGVEDVREHNPDVVYCSLSGYGQSGEHRERVGHDLNYVGMAGLLDMTRSTPDAAPTIPGFPVADMAGGLFSAFHIVSALLSRELGNANGGYLDVSMTDAVLSFSHAVSALALVGRSPRPGGTELTGNYPCYDVYETADGRYVTLAALEPKFWEQFCRAIDREDLVDDHRAPDEATRERVRAEVADEFGTRTRAEWEAELGDEDVMFGLVNTVEEALDSRFVRERGMVTGGGDLPPRVTTPGLGEDGPPSRPTPDLGEHTEEVLREAGLSEANLEALERAGAV